MTPEHTAARLGKLTASRMADAIARTKSGYGASRGNLMAALIVERLTDTPQDTYTTAAMQHGIDTEPEARSAYEFFEDAEVELVEFVPHPTIAMAGASPDGLVGKDGLVEFKCPASATHIETLLNETIPAKYVTQMQWQMACTGRKWCDWVSYDPRMPEQLRLFVKRLRRDEKMIAELEAEAEKFLGELETKLAALTVMLRKEAA